MKNQLNKLQFIGISYVFVIAFALFTAWISGVTFPGDTQYTNHYEEVVKSISVVHFTFNVILVLIAIFSAIIVSVEFASTGETFLYKFYNNSKSRGDSYDNESNKNTENNFSFKKWFIWGLIIFFGIYFISIAKNVITDSAKIYNTSKLYHNSYEMKVQEKKGFYDKLWKTYLQKEKITNINKETFIEVTKIIMENRRDGEQIMWKWVQENQQIPYSEFTKFYEDLSIFITEQREGYFNIEKQCQLIANQNNTLLDTFPNNIYNRVLNCDRINFEYGFTSDSTETVFKNKKE